MNETPQLWIGMAQIAPRSGTETPRGMSGAFVQVASPAVSIENYIERANAALVEEGFDVVEWEDVFPVGPDWPPSDAVPSLVAAADWAVENDDVGLSDLHWFPEEDDPQDG